MERRVTSHTEEEEMNQRRHLLTLARSGDQESIDLLFEFYQVKVFTGDALSKKNLPSFPVLKPVKTSVKAKAKPGKVKVQEKTPKGSVPTSKAKVKAKKRKAEKPKSVSKETSKVRTKTVVGKPQAQKVKKTTKASPKKSPVAKKIVPSKESKGGGKAKGKPLGSAKKSKVAKKK